MTKNDKLLACTVHEAVKSLCSAMRYARESGLTCDVEPTTLIAGEDSVAVRVYREYPTWTEGGDQ